MTARNAEIRLHKMIFIRPSFSVRLITGGIGTGVKGGDVAGLVYISQASKEAAATKLTRLGRRGVARG